MSHVKFPYRYRDGTGCAVEAVAYFPAGDPSLPHQSRPSDVTDDAWRLQAASIKAETDAEGLFVAHQVGLPQVFGFRASDTARGVTVEADYPQADPPRAFEDGHDHGLHHFCVDEIEVVDEAPADDRANRTFVMTMDWSTFRNAFDRRAGAWDEPALAEFFHGDNVRLEALVVEAECLDRASGYARNDGRIDDAARRDEDAAAVYDRIQGLARSLGTPDVAAVAGDRAEDRRAQARDDRLGVDSGGAPETAPDSLEDVGARIGEVLESQRHRLPEGAHPDLERARRILVDAVEAVDTDESGPTP